MLRQKGCYARWLILAMLPLLSLRSATCQSPKLEFVKKIGVGWKIDKWAWMSFVAFNADGTMIASDAATARNDVSGDLTIWSFPDGKLLKRLSVQPMAVSPDFRYFATFNGVGDVATGKPLITLPKDARAIHAFSPDSRYVAESYSQKGIAGPSIRVVQLATGKQISAFGNYSAFSLAISSDGTTLASGHWDHVTLWNLQTGRRVAMLEGFGRYVESLSFSRDGNRLAAGTDTGAIQIWDVPNRKRLHSLQFEGSYVSEPAFSPDGTLVAVGIYGTGSAYLIDTRTGKLVAHELISGIGCGSVAFSPDGRYLITPSTGGLIRWPYDRGGTIRVFQVNVP